MSLLLIFKFLSMKRKISQLLLLGMLVLFASSTFAQIKVKGVVKSTSGEVLPGVSIVVKGTTTGVVSDFDGKYNITVPGAQSVLVYSFVGMQNQEITVNGKTVIDITLTETTIGVDEVVITAMGITKAKKSLAYSCLLYTSPSP